MEANRDMNWYLNSIPADEEKAVHMDALAKRWGMTTRDVRRVIADLRNDGWLIATNNNGYFLSTDLDALKEFYLKSRAKAAGIMKNAEKIREYLTEHGAL